MLTVLLIGPRLLPLSLQPRATFPELLLLAEGQARLHQRTMEISSTVTPTGQSELWNPSVRLSSQVLVGCDRLTFKANRDNDKALLITQEQNYVFEGVPLGSPSLVPLWAASQQKKTSFKELRSFRKSSKHSTPTPGAGGRY